MADLSELFEDEDEDDELDLDSSIDEMNPDQLELDLEDEDDGLEDTHTPALLLHAQRVFEAMLAESSETSHGTVYEGFLTKLFETLNLSVPYYSSVTKALKAMDCIRQLHRGGGKSPSRWLLVQEPTNELFNWALPEMKRVRPYKTKKNSNRHIIQLLTDIRERLDHQDAETERLRGRLDALEAST